MSLAPRILVEASAVIPLATMKLRRLGWNRMAASYRIRLESPARR